MADDANQERQPDTRGQSAGPFGFTRREIVVLSCIAVVLVGVSVWTWWGRHQAAMARYWTVEDVVVDTLLLAKSAPEDVESEDENPVVIEDPGHVLIDVNTADVNELTRLPGIGPVLARRVVDSRRDNGPFASLEDLQRVRGIGTSTAADLEGWVRFSNPRDTVVAADGNTP